MKDKAISNDKRDEVSCNTQDILAVGRLLYNYAYFFPKVHHNQDSQHCGLLAEISQRGAPPCS